MRSCPAPLRQPARFTPLLVLQRVAAGSPARLLPIVDCWNILDDNLLACPRDHVEAIFAMLRRQCRQVEITGGLEARALEDYQVDLLAGLRRCTESGMRSPCHRPIRGGDVEGIAVQHDEPRYA
jgi:hypothetical protein